MDVTTNGRLGAGGNRRRQTLAIVMANALEFFDFTAYAYFAVFIGRAFFPSHAPDSQLLLSLGLFGLGFLARPAGALLIGIHADRAGRRAAMMLTIRLMFAGTALLAFTPAYATIGVAAPALILLARLLQGLSMGGEVGLSVSYLYESACRRRRGQATSMLLITQGCAGVMAGGVGYLSSAYLSPEALQAWGWRLPFMFGLLIYPAGIYLRRTLIETLPASLIHPDGRGIAGRIRGLHAVALLAAVGVMAGPTVTTAIVGQYMTTFGLYTLHLPASTAMLAGVASGLSTIVAAVAAGRLYDRYRRLWLATVPICLLMLAVFPVFSWIADGTTAVLFVSIMALTMLRVAALPLYLVVVPQAFPLPVRATCLSLCYGLATAIFGSTTQYVLTWIISTTGDAMAPAWYLLAANGLTLAATCVLLCLRRPHLENLLVVD